MSKFGDRLRELRQQAGLTQEELASSSSLPLGSIRNYEQNQRQPSWDVVFRLAEALGVDCEAFKECVGASEDKRRVTREAVQPVPAEKKPTGRPRKPPPAPATGRTVGQAREATTAPKRTPRGKKKKNKDES